MNTYVSVIKVVLTVAMPFIVYGIIAFIAAENEPFLWAEGQRFLLVFGTLFALAMVWLFPNG